ncbi:hypothetical protein ACFPK9_04815 [Rubritalea spongiae]|uniref:Uncharacterized protein n=1 Tax=Rubritalea spongiae TaxID=430797 RepID=A0ABW5E8G2_9BACT
MNSVIVIVIAVLGVFLISDGRRRVEHLMAERELNPLELKESPYGEIIGAALQEPVHLLAHGGTGHDHHHGEGHEGCAGCSGCAVTSHEHDHAEMVEVEGGSPWLAQRKSALASLGSMIRRNHNPSGRSRGVREYEQKRIQELVELAYEMDPTNHGNYAMYVTFEGNRGGFEKILEVSQKSLAMTEGRLNDPNDALTSAGAAEMILIYRNIKATRDEVENSELETDYVFFVEKTKEYAEAFDKALAEGRLQQFSQEKVDEMIEIYSRFSYTIRVYGERVEEVRRK